MNLSQDIHPLTDFKRNTPEFLRQLKETGNPVVLTINGKAEIVVQDAASYQRLFDLADRLETIQAAARTGPCVLGVHASTSQLRTSLIGEIMWAVSRSFSQPG